MGEHSIGMARSRTPHIRAELAASASEIVRFVEELETRGLSAQLAGAKDRWRVDIRSPAGATPAALREVVAALKGAISNPSVAVLDLVVGGRSIRTGS